MPLPIISADQRLSEQLGQGATSLDICGVSTLRDMT